MLPNQVIGALHEQLTRVLPEVAGVAREDLQNQIKGIITATLNRLEVVSREDFDIQAAVLEKTRQRVEALEKQLAELEGKSASK